MTHSYAYIHKSTALGKEGARAPHHEWRRAQARARRHIVAGNRIHPRDDTVEEEGDGEESDEDLDGM